MFFGVVWDERVEGNLLNKKKRVWGEGGVFVLYSNESGNISEQSSQPP